MFFVDLLVRLLTKMFSWVYYAFNYEAQRRDLLENTLRLSVIEKEIDENEHLRSGYSLFDHKHDPRIRVNDQGDVVRVRAAADLSDELDQLNKRDMERLLEQDFDRLLTEGLTGDYEPSEDDEDAGESGDQMSALREERLQRDARRYINEGAVSLASASAAARFNAPWPPYLAPPPRYGSVITTVTRGPEVEEPETEPETEPEPVDLSSKRKIRRSRE